MKEVKVVKVSENVRRYAGKHGETFIHEIMIEGDPAPWEYHSLSPGCVKFMPQQMAQVEMEERQNGKHLNRTIKPVKMENSPKDPSSGPSAFGKYKSDKDQGMITWLSCFSSVCNLMAKEGSDYSTIAKFDTVIKYANVAFEEANKHSTIK